MRTFVKRAILCVLALLLLSFAIEPLSAEEYVVENGKITLPRTIIRGNYADVIAKQEILRMEFVREIEESPYEVEDVVFQTTEDGFIDLLFPKFSPKFKTTQSQYRVLAFVRGDKEMEIYEKSGSAAFIATVLRSDEALIKAPVLTMKIGGRKVPILILVKTRSLLIST